MPRLRRLTHCSVPGHGAWCDPARERPPFYERPTEERMALAYELAADDVPPRRDLTTTKD